jgi:CBS domain containing-hemolysin-like protein
VIDAIDKLGYSRLPVFEEIQCASPEADADEITVPNIIGFFLVKKLINVNPNSNKPLSSFPLKQPLVVG